jgi:hypothetical protein
MDMFGAAPAFGAESKGPRDVSLITLIRGILARMCSSFRLLPEQSFSSDQFASSRAPDRQLRVNKKGYFTNLSMPFYGPLSADVGIHNSGTCSRSALFAFDFVDNDGDL